MVERVSRLYRGLVVHTRLRPRRHALTKRIPMVLFDLDELGGLDRDLRLLAIDRPGVFSLQSRHHLAGDATPLKAQVERRLAEEGIVAGGPIRLLCMPAVLGMVFNPISVYFCHRPGGQLAAVLYEVNNTFAGRHIYLLPAAGDGPTIRQGCSKAFHVSPFMDMDLGYSFTVASPGAQAVIGIQVKDADGLLMSASFAGKAEPLTDRSLARLFLRHPLLMLEVLGAIHWQAARLLVKGVRLRPAPPNIAPGTSAPAP